MIYTTILLLLFGCSSQLTENAVSEFKLRNPGVTIISFSPGEGDLDNVYVYIKYKKPTDGNLYQDIVLYQNIKGGNYTVVESSKIYGTGS